MQRLLALVALLATTFAARAQGPAAEWRTIDTAHFRVHYPAGYEAWSVRAASRLESIRDAVTREIGYTPDETIDVVVSNPVADANGIAWPVFGSPRVIFYTEAPGPDEQIGSYSDWIDLLAVHEVAHIVHMLRPSRNPMRRLVEQYVLTLNSILLESPRWVLEGYATVIEGRLTGAGRPSSTLRALILRKWAGSGRMPSYAQLDSDDRFLGMSMAYLAGSAYLEWLERRSGPDSLRHLWRRMTARQRRDFDEAFAGVFGDSPEKLYGLFVAELTASAMSVERTASLREGELWQATSRASGDPAVSPDGKRIALVLRPHRRPAKLVVYDTGPNDEAERKHEKRIAEMLERDPEDVAPVRTKPLPREPLASWRPPDGGDVATPRWLRDGSAILVSHRQPDADGFLHHDLFLWSPDNGGARRVTHLADVLDADPLPDGRSAIAVRSRYGMTQLVRVDLDSGSVSPITEPSFDVVSHPRVDESGNRVVYAVQRDATWSLVIRDLATAHETAIGAGYSWPEWSRTDPSDLFASYQSAGFVEVHHISGDGQVRPITRTSGAFQPAPSPDARLFFMSLEPDGFVVRAIDSAGTANARPDFDASHVPAIPPSPSPAVRFESQTVKPGRPYGIGRQEWASIGGYNSGVNESATEIGVRIGDLIGRLDTIVIGSFGRDFGQRGAALATAWRGWPVEISGHVFSADDHRVERKGIEARATWERQAPRTTLRLEGGGLAGKPFDLGFAAAQFGARTMLGSWRANANLATSLEAGTIRHLRASAAGTISRAGTRLLIRYQRDTISEGDVLEVGGLPSSIVPDSAFAARIFEPALEAGSLTGETYDGIRAEAVVPLLPVGLFYQRHRTDSARAEVAGVTVSLSSEPLPILRIPAFDITLGAATRIDEGASDDINWWVGMRWKP